MPRQERRGSAMDRRMRQQNLQNKNVAPNSSRRKFLGLAAGTATLVALGATGTLLYSTFESSEASSGFPDIDIYYPELAKEKLLEHGSFETGKKQVDWYNFTQLKFDPTAAQKSYQLAESFTVNDWNFSIMQGEKNIPLSIENRRKNVKLFIVDGSQHLTRKGELSASVQALQNLQPDAITYGATAGIDKPLVTVLKVISQEELKTGGAYSKVTTTDVVENINISLFTEACQASKAASVQSDPMLTNIMQEAICNSFGVSPHISSKDQASYPDYKSTIEAIPAGYDVYNNKIPYFSTKEDFFKRLTTTPPFSKKQ